MAKFNGTLKKAYVDNKVISEQMDATLNLSTAEIDTTTKNNGGWTSRIPGLRDWSLDVDVASDLSSANNANETTYAILFDAWLNRKIVNVNFSTKILGEIEVTGPAFITSFSEGVPMEEMASASVTFTAAGPLTSAYVTNP